MKQVHTLRNSIIIGLIEGLQSGVIFLRFPGESEKAFRRYYYKKTIRQLQFSLILGALLYAAFGLLDQYVVPAIKETAWTLRYLVVCPLCVLGLLLSFFVRRETFMQVIAGIVMIAAGTAITMMMLIDPGRDGQIYYGGIVLVIFFTYSFVRLRFGYALFCGAVVTMTYIMTGLTLGHMRFVIFINNIFFIVTSNIVGLSVAYLLEIYIRREYQQAMAMKRTHRELRKLSLFDSLTKIPNRRLFDMRLSAEFNELKNSGQPLSLILLDIDHFKAYNDHLGHRAGDRCLVMIASKVQNFAGRAGDLAARYGGEEFAAILGNASLLEARAVAERIRESIRNMRIPHPNSSNSSVVTVSLGVSTILPADHMSFEALIESADRALYKAKELGRDRVEITSIG